MSGTINAYFAAMSKTVASIQGSTCSGKVYIDLDRVKSSDHLVAVTRTNDIKNMSIASIDGIKLEGDTALKQKTRQRDQLLNKRYFFRQ